MKLSLSLVLLGLAPAPAFALARPPAGALAQETPESLVQQGRALLAQNKANEALPLFERADQLASGALATHQWVLRCWMQMGRINDALDAIDKLAKTEKGPAIDYLYGMGFWFTAKDRLAQNAGGAIIGMNFGDACTYLKKCTQADEKSYPDAWLALAESAWYAQELDTARAAAEKACAVEPKDVPAHLMLGQIAFSQYVTVASDEAQKDKAAAHMQAARAAFEATDALLSGCSTPADRAQRAQAQKQLGDLACWAKDKVAAGKAYGRALGYDPNVAKIDELYRGIAASFDKEFAEIFLGAIELAEKTFVESWGAENAGDATILWWLGWARLDQKQFDKAEEAFAGAVKKWPQYTNAWFFIGVCRYSRQNFDGAVAAMSRHYKENRDDMVSTVLQNKDRYLAILDSLVGKAAEKQSNVEAAQLSEVQALAEPKTSRYWNNAALFWRDAGDGLRRTNPGETEQKLAVQYFETAFQEYEKALELEPGNPNYLNDTAVMLHYYLDRDLERAKSLYQKAAERAAALLEKKGLAQADKEAYQIALRDSKNNLAKLEKGIKTQG